MHFSNSRTGHQLQMQRSGMAQGKGGVLLVEDSEITQLLVRNILQSAGMAIDVAGDGVDALLLLETKAYELVFMDLQLPTLGGVETAREMRRRGFTMPIIALLGQGRGADLERCLDAGMNGGVAKPVEPDVLLSTAASWLEQESALSRTQKEFAATDAPSSGGDPVFDLDLVMARAGGKRELAERMLRLFAEQFDDVGEALGLALEQGHVDAARGTVHLLKGAADTIGARRLAKSAERLENALSGGQPEGVPAMLEDLDASVAAVMKQLRISLPE